MTGPLPLLSVTSRPWQGLNELNLISQDLDNLCRCGYVRVSVSPPKKFSQALLHAG